jgi:hypothetical protein
MVMASLAQPWAAIRRSRVSCACAMARAKHACQAARDAKDQACVA